MAESRIPSSAHCGLDLRPSFKKNYVPEHISVFFEVEIPNLGLLIHLGIAKCSIQFRVTVTLTSDLVL